MDLTISSDLETSKSSMDPKALDGNQPSTPTQMAKRVDAKNPATLTVEQQKQLEDLRKKIDLAKIR